MGQSRGMSAAEAVTNTAVGFVISLASQLVIFGAYGVTLPLADNVLITCWFTAISIARGYLLRRAFNRGQADPGLQYVPAEDLRERFDRESA